jgi:hypothetical protein
MLKMILMATLAGVGFIYQGKGDSWDSTLRDMMMEARY